MSYTWDKRLKSKTAFRKCISRLVREKGWLRLLKTSQDPYMNIPTALQDEILQGFKKFYHPLHRKRAYVEQSNGITWAVDASGKSGGFILMRDGDIMREPNGVRITVSTTCKKPNMEDDIKSACRGSIHFEQILAVKTREGSEIDHCNHGGFKRIYADWRQQLAMDTDALYRYVISNDKMNPETSKLGFRTFKEPILTAWKSFHAQHAQLQELTREEHVLITRTRKRTHR